MRMIARHVLLSVAAAVLVAVIWLLAESRPPLPSITGLTAVSGADRLLGFLAWLGSLLLAVLQPAALGMGDVKQALLIALALGAAAESALLLGLALAATVAAILVVHRGRPALTTAMPLAPFLAAGAAIALALA